MHAFAFVAPTPFCAHRTLSSLITSPAHATTFFVARSPRRRTETPAPTRSAPTPANRAAPTMAAAAADKMLHAVYRVGDLPAARNFLEALGMHALRERDVPDDKYTNVFYGFGPEQRGAHFSLELTYNYGVASYEVGSGFAHFGVAVRDLDAVVSRVRAAGFAVTRAPGDGDGGRDGERSACVQDAGGFVFELLQQQQQREQEQGRRDPLCKVGLRVRDLAQAVRFYEVMGMRVLRSDDAAALLSFSDREEDATALELIACADGFSAGDAYAQIAVSTPDVYDAAKRFEEAGIPIARAPGPVPGIGTKICAVRDPDGWKTVLVDAEDFEKEFE